MRLRVLMAMAVLTTTTAARAELPCGITPGPPKTMSSPNMSSPGTSPPLTTDQHCGALVHSLPGALLGAGAAVGLSVAGAVLFNVIAPCPPDSEGCSAVLNGIAFGALLVPVGLVAGGVVGAAVGYARLDAELHSPDTTVTSTDLDIDSDMGLEDHTHDDAGRLDGIDRRVDPAGTPVAPQQ